MSCYENLNIIICIELFVQPTWHALNRCDVSNKNNDNVNCAIYLCLDMVPIYKSVLFLKNTVLNVYLNYFNVFKTLFNEHRIEL